MCPPPPPQKTGEIFFCNYHVKFGHFVNLSYIHTSTKNKLINKNKINLYKLDTHWTKYDLRKYFFTNRIVNVWNSLLDSLLLS